MRYYKTILAILLVNMCGILHTEAQSLFPIGTPFVYMGNKSHISMQSLFPNGTLYVNGNEAQDTLVDEETVAYYTGCVKMNGWMEGCGHKLSLSEACHRSSYLRFSRKNKAGHWTRVENFTGRGKRSNAQFGTYLMNPFDEEDTNVKETWRTKLKSVVRLELIGDPTGQTCVQERAYDDLDSLVYVFAITQIGLNKVMGYYMDNYGEPIKMRYNDEANYVIIERDNRGFETTISFVGENGYFKKNKDGAFIERNTYDDNGNRLSLMSCDVDGNYMIDRVGNSGQRLDYNSKGDNVSVTNYDEQGNIMKPSKSFYVARSLFDQYGRETECRFYLPNGNPDTIQSGIHGYQTEYNKFGECIFYKCFGLDGKLHNREDGIAVIIRKYDDEGRWYYAEFRDQDSLLVRDDAGWQDEYEGDLLTSEEKYTSEDGIRKNMNVRYTNKVNIRKRIEVDSNSAWEEIYDSQGRMLQDAYFDAHGKPVTSWRGYHMATYVYTASNHTSREEMKLLDTDSTLVPMEKLSWYSYNREVTTYDSLTNLYSVVYYDGDKMLSNYVQQREGNGSDFSTSQYSFDITGKKSRTLYGDNLYYSVAIGRNLKGERTYFAIQNEYGEPAYALTSDNYSPRGWSFNFLGNSMYSNDKNEDKYQKDMISEVKKACIVEIVNDSVNNYGLESGDVIMKYGDWAYQSLTRAFYPDDELRLETFLKNNRTKEIVVMRHNLEKRSPEYHIFQLPAGMPKDFGFVWHYFPYTDLESQRYKDTFKRYRHDQHIPDSVKFYGIDVTEGKRIVSMRTSHIKAYSHEAYKKGIKADALLLGCMMIDSIGEAHTYLAGDTTATLYNRILQEDSIKLFRIWFTEDLNNIKSVDFKTNDELGIYYSTVFVPDSLSDLMGNLTRTVEKEMNASIAPDCTSFGTEEKDSLWLYAYNLWKKDADYRAHRIFEHLYETGYSKVTGCLVQDYLYGYGVAKNYEKAEKIASSCRRDSNYVVIYYIARQYVKDNNGKKAKKYMGYLRQGKSLKWYNELMGKYLLQNGDTLKALPYLNDYMYYLYSKDDSAAIINYWIDYNNEYFVRYPRQAADGMAHLAYNVYDLDYYKDAIATFNKAREINGNLKTEHIDYEDTYWDLLEYMSGESPEQYGEMFNSYIADKCFRIKWKKDNPVVNATGIKGECILLAYNGWNITTTETPYEERRPTSDVEKERHLLLYNKGKVIKYDYTGEDLFTIEIGTVSKEEKARLVRLYEQATSTSDTVLR